MIPVEILKVLRRLNARTIEGKIDWEVLASSYDTESYLTTWPDYSIKLWEYSDQEGDRGAAGELLDSNGRTILNFSESYLDDTHALTELFQNARSRALGVDAAIAYLERELSSDDIDVDDLPFE